jgi:hypothetical protein
MAKNEIAKKRIRIKSLLLVIRFYDFALLTLKKPDPSAYFVRWRACAI